MDDVLRSFLTEIEALGASPDELALAGPVRGLVLDGEYWQYQIGRADGSNLSVLRQDEGVQVALAHRTAGRMSYVHSHHVWVAVSAITGVETHRRYDVHDVHSADDDDGRAVVVLAEERRLRGGSGDVVAMTPPHDVHSHGHVEGSGPWPYSVVVLGDNPLRYQREEFDLVAGRRRVLPPGERGTTDLPATDGA